MMGIVVPLGMAGGPEIMVILVLGVVLFGSSKVRTVARATGESIAGFQTARDQAKGELPDARSEQDRETETNTT